MAVIKKRLPWSNNQEFIDVFEILFGQSSDPNHENFNLNRSIGLNHLYAWSIRSPSGLPPAVESTLSLISVLLQATATTMTKNGNRNSPRFKDETDDNLRPLDPSSSHQSRLGIAMALTRFVNGLVDPLQTGLYARSLSQIATQLKLPLNFVQIRHRSTHEDLPSLSSLIESAQLALNWLYYNYWLPTANEMNESGNFYSNQIQSTTTNGLEEEGKKNYEELINSLKNLLNRYKRFRKKKLMADIEKKDNKGKSKGKSKSGKIDEDRESRKIQDEIFGWVKVFKEKIYDEDERSRGAVCRDLSRRLDDGYRDEDQDDDDDEIENYRKCLEIVAQVMCQSNFLVPKSVSKRNRSNNKFDLPKSLKELYIPLIHNLNAQSTSKLSIPFKRVLIMTILDNLRFEETGPDLNKKDQIRRVEEEQEEDENMMRIDVGEEGDEDEHEDGGLSNKKSYFYTISGWLIYLLRDHNLSDRSHSKSKVEGQENEDSENDEEDESFLTHQVLKKLIFKLPNQYTIELIKTIKEKLFSPNDSSKEEDQGNVQSFMNFTIKTFKTNENALIKKRRRGGEEEDERSSKKFKENKGEDERGYFEERLKEMKRRLDRLIEDQDQSQDHKSEDGSQETLTGLENRDDKHDHHFKKDPYDQNYDWKMKEGDQIKDGEDDDGYGERRLRFSWKLVEPWEPCPIGLLTGENLPDLYQSI